jgi:hypothetical protein
MSLDPLVYLNIALAILFVFVLLKALTLWYALTHQHRAPRGQFKITVPADQWDEQVAAGAIAVAITDVDTNRVYMTILIQKEASS